MYLISGMHRSGTSLVAQLFHRAGADLGSSDTLYGADRWNPGGYFEQKEVQAVNIPLIHGPWGKLTYFRLPNTSTILRRAARRQQQIATVAAKYQDKVVKETRFCLTLPAWLAHGAQIRLIIICLRNPSAVAQSLRRRNWIQERLAYRLWQIHLQRLLQHVGEIPTWLVRYDHLLDPEKFSAEIGPAARLCGLQLDQQRLRQLCQENVKPTWDHHCERTPDLPPEVESMWQKLLSQHADQRLTQSHPHPPVPGAIP